MATQATHRQERFPPTAAGAMSIFSTSKEAAKINTHLRSEAGFRCPTLRGVLLAQRGGYPGFTPKPCPPASDINPSIGRF